MSTRVLQISSRLRTRFDAAIGNWSCSTFEADMTQGQNFEAHQAAARCLVEMSIGRCSVHMDDNHGCGLRVAHVVVTLDSPVARAVRSAAMMTSMMPRLMMAMISGHSAPRR